MYFDLQFSCDITLKMPGHMLSVSFRLHVDRTVFLFTKNIYIYMFQKENLFGCRGCSAPKGHP